ncbi:NADPH:quinone reductase-like Zn-dependent oxidoreductase [Paraburkholderia youngii]
MRAIQIHEYGGPEVLRRVELDIPKPGSGEVLISWGAYADFAIGPAARLARLPDDIATTLRLRRSFRVRRRTI